jgi:hypothetical protein
MKERVNLSIDKELLKAMKTYAAGRRKSVSELVEDYFRTVTRPIQRRNIVEMMDELERAIPDSKGDLKELFYRKQEGKYGF